jgi:hypothetical protein
MGRAGGDHFLYRETPLKLYMGNAIKTCIGNSNETFDGDAALAPWLTRVPAPGTGAARRARRIRACPIVGYKSITCGATWR